MTTTAPGHVHFLGIGGAGLSALAQIWLGRGGEASGSDQVDSPRIARLRALGAHIRVGPGDPATLEAGLADADLVVMSSAVAVDDPELVAAHRLGIPVRKRSAWLPELTAGSDLVAVAGSHGKTTTSSMLALVLRDAGLDPTVVVGADVPQIGGSAVLGSGPLFVLEADEYDGAFAGLDPMVAIITNVEWEHPDYFPDEQAVRTAFTAFASRVRPDGRLIVCGDHPGVQAVLSGLPAGHAPVVTYGTAVGLDWRARDTRPDGSGGTLTTVLRAGTPVGTMRLRLPGAHNVANALAVLAASDGLGVPLGVAMGSLGSYTGAARRFETVGTAAASADGHRGPVDVVDDYAHHPTEIRATLAAARQRAGTRPVWAIVQPHTFSRLAALLEDFATAFGNADRVYVTDIYAAREHDDLGLHPTDLVKRIARPAATSYVPWDALVGRVAGDLRAEAPDGALVLTLGAGTITTVGPALLKALASSA